MAKLAAPHPGTGCANPLKKSKKTKTHFFFFGCTRCGQVTVYKSVINVPVLMLQPLVLGQAAPCLALITWANFPKD